MDTYTQSRSLHQVHTKRFFDASKPEDLQEALEFVKTGRWTNCCPFVVDWPYTNVPDMIKTEVLLKYLPGIIKETRSKKATSKRSKKP